MYVITDIDHNGMDTIVSLKSIQNLPNGSIASAGSTRVGSESGAGSEDGFSSSAHGRTDEGGFRKTQMCIFCVICGSRVSAQRGATFARVFGVSAAILNVFLLPPPFVLL